jgi:hypothetical protein
MIYEKNILNADKAHFNKDPTSLNLFFRTNLHKSVLYQFDSYSRLSA